MDSLTMIKRCAERQRGSDGPTYVFSEPFCPPTPELLPVVDQGRTDARPLEPVDWAAWA